MFRDDKSAGPVEMFEVRKRRWTCTLAAGDDLERRACTQLQRLVADYDIDRWGSQGPSALTAG